MGRPVDPYEELGLARDASAAEVRRAGRRRARQTHPDAGGDPEAFHRSRRALAVLSDPARRARFDSDGTVEDDRPDNDRAGALQIIEKHLAALLNAHIGSGFAPATDPCFRNVVGELRAAVRKEIAEHEGGIETGKKVEKFYARVAKRLRHKRKGAAPDFLGRSMEDRLRQTKAHVANFEEGIRIRRLALDILKEYEFDPESPFGGADHGFVALGINTMGIR